MCWEETVTYTRQVTVETARDRQIWGLGVRGHRKVRERRVSRITLIVAQNHQGTICWAGIDTIREHLSTDKRMSPRVFSRHPPRLMKPHSGQDYWVLLWFEQRTSDPRLKALVGKPSYKRHLTGIVLTALALEPHHQPTISEFLVRSRTLSPYQAFLDAFLCIRYYLVLLTPRQLWMGYAMDIQRGKKCV